MFNIQRTRILVLTTSLFAASFCVAKSIDFGIISHTHDEKTSKALQKIESQAVKEVLNESVHYKVFSSDNKMIEKVAKHPKKYSLIYVKPGIEAKLSEYTNWKKVAQLLAIDPDTKQLSPTYTAYLVSSKKSKIKQLSDLANKTMVYYNKDSVSNYVAMQQLIADNKIPNVHWVHARDIKHALSMVAKGKADAIGLWSYHFLDNKHSAHFTIITKVNGLQNPSLYGNTLNLTTEQLERLKKALQQESAKAHSMFSFN